MLTQDNKLHLPGWRSPGGDLTSKWRGRRRSTVASSPNLPVFFGTSFN